MKRPWSVIPINDCGEDLVQIKTAFYCLEPHPYLSLGAPYGHCADPWRLRRDVFNRLCLAQQYLQLDNPQLRLAIFDAWRPIPVQAFMVEYAINKHCLSKGLDRNDPLQRASVINVVQEVEKFWAAPSKNPSTPPPHSTGGAVDLTIANSQGVPLDMGGNIDQLGPISSPSYYLKSVKNDDLSRLFHQRRISLANVMEQVGFVQHPNEWWHFSYGDQLWAWKTNSTEAHYGTCEPVESKNCTASMPRYST